MHSRATDFAKTGGNRVRRQIQAIVALCGQLVWLAFLPIPSAAQSAPAITPQGKPEVVIQGGHAAPVTSIAFGPDGRLLASGGADSIVILWDTATGRQLRTLTGHTAPIAAVTFSPDGRWVASAGQDNVVKLWEAATGRNLLTLAAKKQEGKVPGFTTIAFSPDGRLLAAGNRDNTVRVWEAESGQELSTLTPQAATTEIFGLTALAFSPDGQLIVTGHGDGTVKLWQTSTGKELHTLASPPQPREPSPEEKALAEAASKESQMPGSQSAQKESPQAQVVADALPGAMGALANSLTAQISAVTFSPDGRSAAAIVGDDVKLWDSETGQELRHFALPVEVNELASEMAKEMGTTPTAQPGAVTFSGRWVAYQAGDQAVRVRDITTAREIVSLTVPAERDSIPICLALALSRDGRWLAWADLNNSIKLWDLTIKKPK